MAKVTIQGKEYFTPTNDLVFKTLFTNYGDYTFLYQLLNAFLTTKIENIHDIHIENTELLPSNPSLKSHQLDLLVDTPNQLINIEIQVVKDNYELERILKYSSRMIEIQGKRGYTYSMRKKVVVLWIADHSLSYLSNHSRFLYHFIYCDKEDSSITIDLSEIILVDLTLIPKDTNNKAILWAKFIKIKREEELDLLRHQDDYLDRAIQVWEQMNNDKSLYELFKTEEDIKEDYEHSLYYAKQEGLEEGLEEGINKGIRQGIGQGIKETAIKMKLANLDVSLIMQITGLSKEEIEQLV